MQAPGAEASQHTLSPPDTAKPWQQVCADVQAYRDATVEAVFPALSSLIASEMPLNVTAVPANVLSSEELRITSLVPEELLRKLASGEVTCMETTNAFLRRAAIAQHLVNCVTELLPERARDRARYLDQYITTHGRPIGPLHGLPISVKEHVSMEGLDCNAGFVSWVGRVALEDALILKILWEAGAVFYVRTTEPQTIMHLETSSNLYGVTVNPYNRLLTSGGSSGGEGALIGLHGSCLGIGTDIGGSIRSPAANNGIFGLRPTAYRLPVKGMEHTMGGAEQILGVIGPLSTSIEGIKLFMQTLIDAQPWLIEPSLIPLPWRSSPAGFGSSKKKIRVAVMSWDGIVRPHPPVERALEEVAIKMLGNELVDVVHWEPSGSEEAWEIISHLFFPEEGRGEADAINASGEPWRPLSQWVITDNPHVSYLSVEGVWEWTAKREAFRAKYAEKWNASSGKRAKGDTIDVILCPAGPGAAPPLDCARYWNYTSLWNLLDWPALVFPVTTVHQEKDTKDEGYVPKNEADQYNYDLYTGPEQYKDAPIGLQLVCRRFEDEKVIEAYEYLKELGCL